MKQIFGILIIVLLSGCALTEYREDVQEEQCPKEKSLLVSYFEGWGEDKGELVFGFYIINYGYEEAKNVTIGCYSNDKDGNRLFDKEYNIGSVGSVSWIYKDMVVDKFLNYSEDDVGFCQIISCVDCEILNDRVIGLEV